ncbi:MBL fold metallo-hydrolase [Aquisalimonas sp.]|uniref:MBL fold metallo-hydrolase n=1 Tax=Aquisalimonas sp. TaxID=1872621 RepID=UPI0025B91C0B|nr:MBL fold metallo-hydrolase [Aquisalimonas sp.]
MSEPSMTNYPAGVTAIDAEFAGTKRLVASHLVVDAKEAALVDVGSNFSVPLILRALERKKVARSQVRYVCVTHVHLDHAGGAGELMRQLPEATLVVHPRAARHMIDPSGLYEGTKAIHGERAMARDYGELVPVPEPRIEVVNEGDRLPLGTRDLLFLDTPGHANHHYSIVDTSANVVFSGDTFGVSYRSLDTANGAFIFPSTSPVHFDPQAAHRSVERLRNLEPDAIYLAHFSQVTEIDRLADDLHRELEAYVDIAHRHRDAGDAQANAIAKDLVGRLTQQLQAHGKEMSEQKVQQTLALDLQMNTQGLQVWLQRQA